jgi:AhpD family alkylhydroperoxidase
VADEEQKLSEDQRELVAIGASIGAGCHPCVSHHLKAGAKAGLSVERLLGSVVRAELAAAESAERLTDHVRAQLGSEVREPKVTPPLDEALASLGGALGANDLANVERQLLAAQQHGVSRSQLRDAIELGRGVQENATRMHFRAALDLLERATATGQQTEETGAREEPACDEATAGEPSFISMMARFFALMDSYDGAGLREKMAECCSIFEAGCCRPGEAAAGEERPTTTSTSASSGECGCAAASADECAPSTR